MNKLLFLLPLFLLLIGTAQATSNTLFTENGLPTNTMWYVTVQGISNLYVQTFNSLTNTISTNAISSYGIYKYISFSPSWSPYYGTEGFVGNNNLITFTFYFNANLIYTITTFPYELCPTIVDVCVPYTGDPPATASDLSKGLPSPYSANLTIYTNPQGFYEYVINNGSTATIPTQLYYGIPPGELLAPINLSASSTASSNGTVISYSSTYSGAIFYSQQIDISPIEYQAQNANLTPYNFETFVEQNLPSFYNTTLIFQTSNNSFIKAVSGFEGWLITSGCNVINSIVVLKSNCVSQNSGTSKGETYAIGEGSVPVQTALPIVLYAIPNNSRNEQLFVSYAYQNPLCSNILGNIVNGVCIQTVAQGGMVNFNNYIDNTYSPQVALSQFMSNAVPTLFLIVIAIFLVKKLNGSDTG